MDNKKEVLDTGNEGVKGLMETIASKVSVDQSKEMLSNLKDSIVDNIHERTERAASFINSLKKDKIRNLERLLDVTRKELKKSDKKNYIYITDAGRMVVIDRDMWGEPCTVTVKEGNRVMLRLVKFFNDYPYLFPVFNEKNLNGEIIFMTDGEIWYRDKDVATLVLFKNDKPDFLTINLEKVKGYKEKDLLKYLENCKILYLEKRLNDLLLVERKIAIEDIVRVRPGYAIYKNSERTFTILLFDQLKALCDEFTLRKLPNLSEEALDVLFTLDIVEYIKSKGYAFENFKQDNDHIEYWQEIGSKRVCVMRYKI
ncbi:hypothetical protein [Acetivibrio mesophilus]|uniref:Uncharacterized protein n=1 Tax=Acetivibrio mesophilus TaxID=2487273 RepID=A0A4Q0I6I5_9FIRM|nr:hypothetical protein [Acetivibrio mesophilus]ODM25008.1 hypothetical protein A7W90_01560 [Clostridium sp. Bc-iso-3]RXE59993.1 hypothetical protein EFD62_04365 [Acetivibrio mesophilus]HHV29420.1 hypothetical protein [Clostridium sp.]